MKKLIFCSLIILTFNYSYSNILYVKYNSVGANNGANWLNAFTSLQSALNAATSGDQIWVASGIYTPSYSYDFENTTRFYHFRMKSGVAIYGGFAGNESSNFNLSNRNFVTNQTILSGDIGIIGDNSDNCYHVFFNPSELGLTNTAILDGFTITNGNANGPEPHTYGAGIYNNNSNSKFTNCIITNNIALFGGGMFNFVSNPFISNCTFSNNSAGNIDPNASAGGLWNELSSSTITDCSFKNNYTSRNGGGIVNYKSSSSIINCTFINNNAIANGGGIYNNSSTTSIINCSFSSNSTTGYGGGICNDDFSLSNIINCSIAYNSANAGGGAIYQDGVTNLENSILWANDGGLGKQIYIYKVKPYGILNIYYSCFSNGTNDVSGTITVLNSITSNPNFVNVSTNDLRIFGNSPCINSGFNSYNSTNYDIRGQNRIQNSIIDMGAYEFTSGIDPVSSLFPIITTEAIININMNSAFCGGYAISDGGSQVTSRGVCWNTTGNPTITDSKTIDGTGLGSFSSTMTGLNPSTNYFVRAYATNSQGTSYGTQLSFLTLDPVPEMPVWALITVGILFVGFGGWFAIKRNI